MMTTTMMTRALSFPILAALTACGGDDGPPIVVFGDPTILALVNPSINDANDEQVAQPGSVYAGIDVALDSGPADTTDAAGIAVLSPVPPGDRRMSFTDAGVDGEVTVAMGDRELREVAVAVDDSGAEIMTEVNYDFGAAVLELTPDTPIDDVIAALESSDQILLFHGGTYVVGDVEMTGSRVTLFGDSLVDRAVIIDGNVDLRGSSNRIRGAIITGTLTIDGSDAGVSFTTVEGPTIVTGSSARLLANDLCGEVTVSGSNLTAIGNAGLAPIPAACP
jgi:hypothetical protein